MTEFRSGSLSDEVQREWTKNARFPETEWIGMSRPPGKGVKVSEGYQAEFERIDKLEKERKEAQKRKVDEAKRQREAEEQRLAEQRRQQQARLDEERRTASWRTALDPRTDDTYCFECQAEPRDCDCGRFAWDGYRRQAMSQTPDVPVFAVPNLHFSLDALEDLPAEQLSLVPFRPDTTEEHRQRAYEIFWARKEAAERAGSGGAQENAVGLQVGKANAPWTGSRRRLSSIGDTEEGLPTPGGSQDGGAADLGEVVPAGDLLEMALTNGQAHPSASTSASPLASSSQTNHFNQPLGAPSSSLAPLSNSITDPSSDSAKSPFGAFPANGSILKKNGFYADASSSGGAPLLSNMAQKKDKGKGKAVAQSEEAEEFSGTTTSETTPSFSPSTSAHPRSTRSTRSTDAKKSSWQRGPDRSIEVVVEIPLHPAMTNLSPALRKKLFGKKAAVKNEAGAEAEKVASTVSTGTKRKTRSSLAAAEQAEDEASERAAKKRKTSAASEAKKPARASPSTAPRRGSSSTTSTASTGKRKTRRSSSAGFEVLIETPMRSTPLAKASSSIKGKGKGKGAAGTPSVRFTDNGDILVGSHHLFPQLSRSKTVISTADQEMLDTGNDVAVGPVASGSGLAPIDRSSTLAEASSTAAADDDAELLAKNLALTSENAAQAGPSTSSASGLAKAAKEAHDGLFSGAASPIDLDEATMARLLAAVESNPKEEQEKAAAEEEVDELDDGFGLAQLENEFGIGEGKGTNPVEPAVDTAKAKADAPAPPPFATGSSTAPAASSSSSAKPTSSRSRSRSRSQPADPHRSQRATSATDDEDALVSPSLRVDVEGKKRRRKARMSGELERAVKRCASV
ncbi:hypothetical protein JCM10296v2_000697 [Rhodotorula toruloides]